MMALGITKEQIIRFYNFSVYLRQDDFNYCGNSFGETCSPYSHANTQLTQRQMRRF